MVHMNVFCTAYTCKKGQWSIQMGLQIDSIDGDKVSQFISVFVVLKSLIGTKVLGYSLGPLGLHNILWISF